MLVLSRKNRECVMVGGGGEFHGLLKVTVLDISGASVRLGFELAKDIPVHRLEIWERLCANGDLAHNGAGPKEPAARAD